MSELKSCPFCGGDVDMLRAEVDEVGKVLYMPRCRECRAAILMKGQGEYTAYKSAEAAAAAWNTRHEETCRNVSDPPEGFLCSECGWGDFAEPSHLLTGSCYAGLAKGPRYCPNCGRKVEQ